MDGWSQLPLRREALLVAEGAQVGLETVEVQMVSTRLDMHTTFPAQADRGQPRQLQREYQLLFEIHPTLIKFKLADN